MNGDVTTVACSAFVRGAVAAARVGDGEGEKANEDEGCLKEVNGHMSVKGFGDL